MNTITEGEALNLDAISFKRLVDGNAVDISGKDIFAGKKIAVFGVPGAFTPTCSTTHLPGYEAKYDEILEQDVDEIYCLSVNDSFVMNAWFDSLGISMVQPIADGNADFTRQMGMLVKKEPVCFGYRSQRYSMVVDNGRVEMIFVEEGKEDNMENVSTPHSDGECLVSPLRVR